MGLTVREALAMDCLAKAKLVAGHRGLEREITFVNIMEVPEVVRWMKGGELLLTSGYALKEEDAEFRKNLIRSLAQKGVAAFAVKLGQHWKEMPPELIEAANEVNLPLLIIPEDMPYMDIMVPIMEKLLNMQVAQLKRYESVHNRLLGVLLAGGDYDDLCQTLHQILSNPTLIVDRRGFCLASCMGEEGEEAELLRERVLEGIQSSEQLFMQLQPNRSHYVKLSLGSEIQPVGIVPIKVNDKIDGALIAIECHSPLEGDALRTMEYAGPVVALVFAKEKAVLEAQRQLTGDFLEELVNNTFNDEELMEKRARFLHFSLQEPLAAFVIQLSGPEDYYVSNQEDERQVLKEFLWDKVHEAFAQANTVMLQVKRTSLVGLARVKSKKELRHLQAVLNRIVHEAKEKRFQALITAGIGRPYTGARNVSKSYQEALTAAKVGGMLDRDGAVCYFEDLGPYRFLYELRGSQEMQSFHREVIGAIRSYDQVHRTSLLETLARYFEHDGNIKKTAAAMHLHKNTVLYRLKKIEEITGLDLRNPNDRFCLELGMKLDKIFHS